MSADIEPSDPRLRHATAACDVGAKPSAVFDYIDRPEQLSSHVARRSLQLESSAITIGADAAGGRSVGSHIRLAGRMRDNRVFAECTVVRRDEPKAKTWETIGEPDLLLIGRYRMSVNIEPRGDHSRVRIAIYYALPERSPARWLGALFGQMYARWRVKQMARDLVHHFDLPYR